VLYEIDFIIKNFADRFLAYPLVESSY